MSTNVSSETSVGEINQVFTKFLRSEEFREHWSIRTVINRMRTVEQENLVVTLPAVGREGTPVKIRCLFMTGEVEGMFI